MSQRSHGTSALPTKTLEATPPQPPNVEGHDEWLLDEALTETFPASDAIAVSPDRRSHPAWAGPPVRPR